MKKHILIGWVLVMLTAGGRASDVNQTTSVPAAKPAEAPGNGLMALAEVGKASDATQTAVITTNKSRWESTVAFGLTLTSGNSESVLTTASFNTRFTNPTNELILGVDGSYGENNSVENNENLHGFSQYNHLFSAHWFGYARVDGLHDGIANVVYRVTLSPGLGYYFIKTKVTALAGEVGPGVVLVKLDGQRKSYVTPRLAERFEHKVNDHARIWENAEFLPQPDRLDNFLVNAEVGIETTISKRLSLRTVVQDNFANDPAPGRKDNDIKLVSGLAYKF